MSEPSWILAALAVSFGGALGALSRFALAQGLWAFDHPYSFGVWLANLCGCLGAGLVYGYLARHQSVSPYLKSALLVGFFGALTTLSTLVLETLRLLFIERFGWAVFYFSSSVIGAFLLAFAGLKLAERIP